MTELKIMNRKKKITILIVILVLAAAATGIYWYTRPKEVTNYDAEFEEDQERPDSTDQEGSVADGIQIPGYKSITIPAGTKDVSVELMNPEENQVYFQISFYLPDTEETIYTSKMIKPGQHLYEITLEKEMAAGEYPLTVRYDTFSADEAMTPRNGAEVNCTLIVE